MYVKVSRGGEMESELLDSCRVLVAGDKVAVWYDVRDVKAGRECV